MIYKILADISLLFHFLWILFLVFGVIFVLRRSKIAWLHLGGLLFSFFINIIGWYCPLTYLENYLRMFCNRDMTYSGSFMLHYLGHFLGAIIYPDLPETTIRTGALLFVCLNLVVYAIIGVRHRLKSQLLAD
jgi:hypothetical protein